MFGTQDGADTGCLVTKLVLTQDVWSLWQLDFPRETDLSFPWEKFPVESRQYAHSQLGHDSMHIPSWVKTVCAFPVGSRQYAHSQLGQDSSHNSPILVKTEFTIHS